MLLTEEQKAAAMQAAREHRALCGCDAGHEVACAAHAVYNGRGETKRLRVNQAVALHLMMQGRFALQEVSE